MEHGDFARAEATAESAIKSFRKTYPDWAARFLVLKGEVFLREGQSAEALAILNTDLPQSLETDDVQVRRLVAKGVAYYRLQDFEASEAFLTGAERLAQGKSDRLQAEVAINRGTIFAFDNDYDKAEKQYRRALALGQKTEDSYIEANAFGGLGLTNLRQQKYDQSIDWFDRSLEVAKAMRNEPLQIATLGNLGWCYYKLGDLDRAYDLFVQAENGFRKVGSLQQQQIFLNDLGFVTYDHQHFQEAVSLFEQSLAIAQKTRNQAAIATVLGNLATVAIETGDLARAEKYNSEALELQKKHTDREGESEVLENEARIAAARGDYWVARADLKKVIEATTDVFLLWQAQADLGEVYAKQQRHADADREFQKGLATIDDARASLNIEEHRLSFLTSASRFYNSYIDFLVEHGRANDALRIVEHSRARTLAEGLGLKSASLNSALAPEQVSRQSGAVVLEYWLKPEHSYLWAVTPNKVAHFKLPADAEINAAVQDYRKVLLGPRDPLETGNATGRKLYDMLVAPAQKLIRPGARVIIIADGALNNLNFETLIAPIPKPHYWIEDVTLSDASSLALLAGSRHATTPRQRNLLLVGNPTAASPEYPRLPQAAAEINRVEQHFPTKARLVLEGPQATPQAYLTSDTGRFSYVHFVAHGTASRTTPLESAVILSPQGDSYKLYARDIVNKPLHADLVTISTCYGAGSRAYTGEGLVGLSWAFLRAGAHNTIAALWEVNDASTAKLMDQLYAGIDKGKDPATALRAAKLAMAHSDGVYRRPFYWAPFQLYQGSSEAEPQVSAPHSVR